MAAVWSTLVLALLLSICFFVFNVPQVLWNYQLWKAMRVLPGWPMHWFWGNLHQLEPTQKTMLKMRAYVQKNEFKLVGFWVGPFFPMIRITHCGPVHKVIKLSKDDNAYSYLTPWLGDGLLISEGKKWLRNRHLLTPTFHYDILKGYVPVINNCLEIFLKKWSVSAKDGVSVCTFKDVSKLSLDTIMRCAFSTKSNCQLSDDHPYINSVSKLILLLDERFYNILHRSDLIYSLSASGRRFKQVCQNAHNYTESVIRERKKALRLDAGGKEDSEIILKRASEQRKYLDFLDILLTARDKDGRGLTDLEIRDEADTFMLEGHDTTTSGMSWTLYCLAQHPEHQDKIHEEVKSVLMGREWLEYEDLKELNYTQWCIKEAMRVYPPVFGFFRNMSEDIEIEGHISPKGMLIGVSVLDIHHHPDTWKNPSEYDPLRFHPSNAEGRNPYAYIPFSAGYRNCIGQNFALNEEKMVIASIIQRFQVSLDETHEVEIVPKIILRTKNDIKLKLISLNGLLPHSS